MLKIIILSLVVFALIAGGYFVFNKFYLQKSVTIVPQPQSVSCLTGIEGNSGDNYCSNYHQTFSKCKPGFDNTYLDGCTK